MHTERAVIRVLVVDDEESQRTALAGMIALWGYSVETAADGQEALDKLADFRRARDRHRPEDAAHDRAGAAAAPEGPGRRSAGDRADRVRKPGNRAVATIHDLGAFWFLEKPVQSQALRLLIERAAAQQASGGTRRAAGTPSWATTACWAKWSARRQRCRKSSR